MKVAPAHVSQQKDAVKSGKMFRKRAEQQESFFVSENKSNAFFGTTPFFSQTPNSIQNKCADCEAEQVQRVPTEEEPEIQQKTIEEPDIQASMEEEPDVQAKCETCEEEQVQRAPAEEEPEIQQKADEEPDVQAKCETCEEEQVQRSEIEEDPDVHGIEEESQLPNVATKLESSKPDTSTTDVSSETSASQPPLVQASLKVGQPDDPYEREADQMGEQVMRMPEKIFSAPINPASNNNFNLQRKEEEETPDVQGKIVQLTPSLQRQANGSLHTTTNFASRLQSSTSGGASMSPHIQQGMESTFGTDFSSIRIHTDSNAVQLNKEIGAQAFTYQNNIFFNSGKYAPETSGGRSLLAHELTHTVQQGAAVKRQPTVTPAPAMVQALAFEDIVSLIPDWVKSSARNIPGYTLFTVIIEYDPLYARHVQRTPINLVEGLMRLLGPIGGYIFDKLQEYQILQTVFNWVQQQLQRLNLTTQGLMNLLDEAADEISFPYTDAIDVISQKLARLRDRVVIFVESLVDQIMQWVKDALISVAEPYLQENRAWSLVKKIISYDPLRDEPVNATTVEILEDFLRLIGKETELEQMRERNTLQRTANWLDTQIGIFRSLIGELRGLITAAWDAIQPENLPNIVDNLQSLATDVTGFLQRVWDFASTVALQVLQLIKDALLSWLSSVAATVRGFPLVTVVIGKNPFTNEQVERTVPNLVRGFMSLMEGGLEQYNQMEQSGAIANIVGEIQAAVDTLNMTPQYVLRLFTDIWNSFTIDDLVHPLDAFERVLDRFGAPIGRLIDFVIEIVRIVIVAILQIMNFPFDVIENIINRAMAAIESIKRDPIGFIKNLLRAIKQGFIQFFGNIVTHLIGGVTGWLMSELRDAGIPPLTDFSLRGVIGWVLEVLGISMEKIWEKLAAHPRIGPARVARIRSMIDTLEGIWTFIKDVQERGMAAIWDKIQERLTNLWDTILDAVKNWVTEQIINRVTARLLSMLDPTGIMAVVNSAIAIYSAIESFVRYMREMLDIINSFVNGVADIAEGNVTTAANYLERTMGQAMPVVIGFLANQVGLSGVGTRVGEMIEDVRAMVDQALTWLVNKAVDTGMNLLDRVMGRGNQPPGADSLQNALREVDTEGTQKSADGQLTREDAEQIKTDVNRDHPTVIEITSIRETATTWDFDFIQKTSLSSPASVPKIGSFNIESVRMGFENIISIQPHNQASDYKNSSFSNLQSAHIMPTSAMIYVENYSRGNADTILLPANIHTPFDRYWKDWSHRNKHRGCVTLIEFLEVLDAAAKSVPELAPHAGTITNLALTECINLLVDENNVVNLNTKIRIPYSDKSIFTGC